MDFSIFMGGFVFGLICAFIYRKVQDKRGGGGSGSKPTAKPKLKK